MLEDDVESHVDHIFHRPVGYVGDLEGSRSGSVMALRLDKTRRSNYFFTTKIRPRRQGQSAVLRVFVGCHNFYEVIQAVGNNLENIPVSTVLFKASLLQGPQNNAQRTGSLHAARRNL